jgi:hypothetical protein
MQADPSCGNRAPELMFMQGGPHRPLRPVLRRAVPQNRNADITTS